MRYPDHADEPLVGSFRRMSDIAQEMVGKAGRTLLDRNLEEARELVDDDDEMDNLRRSRFRQIVSRGWSHGVDKAVEKAVDAALLGRYYERIADHAVAMGRRIIYIITGEAPEGDDLADLPEPTCLARDDTVCDDAFWAGAQEATGLNPHIRNEGPRGARRKSSAASRVTRTPAREGLVTSCPGWRRLLSGGCRLRSRDSGHQAQRLHVIVELVEQRNAGQDVEARDGFRRSMCRGTSPAPAANCRAPH